MTFDECKDQIARERGYPDWDSILYSAYREEELYDECASLYATEMIKADREQIIASNLVDCDFMNDSKKYEGYMLDDEIRKLPINLK